MIDSIEKYYRCETLVTKIAMFLEGDFWKGRRTGPSLEMIAAEEERNSMHISVYL